MAFDSHAPTHPRERAALIHARLVAQSLVEPRFTSAHQVLTAFGAMQGQDLPGLFSSIALRLDQSALSTSRIEGGPTPAGQPSGPKSSDVDSRIREVIAAFDNGDIVRGYPMRGTVFGMSGHDARWITELCAKPRDWEAAGRRARLGLTPEHVAHAQRIAHRALVTENGLSRTELLAEWEQAGIETSKGRGYHLITYFIASGELIYGAYNGKDNQVMLAAHWLAHGSGIEHRFNGDRIAATAALLQKYLTSHGPATVRDFAWWTKLPQRDIKPALALIGDTIEQWGVTSKGDALYCRAGLRDEVAALAGKLNRTHLLPGFDEIMLGYPDRLALMTKEQHDLLAPGNNGVFMKSMIRRGQVRGMWRNTKKAGSRPLVLEPFAPLSATAEKEAQRVYVHYPQLH